MRISLSKKKKQVRDHDPNLKKGLLLLKDKLYKQAMIELKVALEKNPSAVLPELKSLFLKYEDGDNIEITLTIGLVLFQVEKTEELALKLGNYSRKLKNYKQANNLYRQVLKLNRSNKLAFYNLAASMGKLDVYDQDIIRLIKRNFTINDYVFPDFINGNATISRLKEEVKKDKLAKRSSRLNHLQALQEEADTIGDNRSLEGIKKELEELSAKAVDASYEEVAEAFQSQTREISNRQLVEEEKEAYYSDCYNFGLFALVENDISTALDNFLLLKRHESKIESLDLCLALASDLNGHREEALRIMQEAIRLDPDNRLLNINLALMYQKNGNRLLAFKYQAVASVLLEKSDGCIHFAEMLQKADNYFKNDQLDDALKIYKIVADEANHLRAWLNIGEINLLRKRHLEALEAFNQTRKIAPDSKIIQAKLKEVHMYYCGKGDELFNDSKFTQAAVLYERALSVARLPQTIEKLISVYKKLNKHRQVQELFEEQQQLYRQQTEEKKEQKRNNYIEQGKIFLRQKNFDAAINNFENAFGLRADKDVFAFLAHIYKSLNRKRMLRSLVERWKMIQDNEKRKENAKSYDEAFP